MKRREGRPERGSRIGSGVSRGAAVARIQAMRAALSHDLIRAGRVLERRGMIVATEGNLSARLAPDRILITRRSRRKGELKARDFVELLLGAEDDPDALLAASTEHPMHLAAYTARSDIEALVHAHPVGLSAYAIRGVPPDVEALEEARVFVRRIGMVPHRPSGSAELAAAVAAALTGAPAGHGAAGGDRPEPGADVLILRNHGALAVGSSVEEALSRLEIAEHLAITLLHAERRPG